MRLKHIENHIEQQLALAEIISHSYENLIKNGTESITPQRVKTRLSILKENWEQFSLEHKAINLAVSELTELDKNAIKVNPYFIKNLFISTHECYSESIEKLSLLLEPDQGSMPRTSSSQSISLTSFIPSTNTSTSTSSATLTCHHRTRLPRLDLPKFNGTRSDWLNFKGLFCSLVLDNPTLSLVEKLQYLKLSLIGPPALLLKNTSLVAENFQKAWDSLVAYYENTRLLLDSALQSLFDIKRMTKESAGELEKLYTHVTQIYRTLETLQRPVSYWDDFLVFLVVQKLDSESLKLWEQHLGSRKDPPTWKELYDFLVARLLTLKACEKKQTTKNVSSPVQSFLRSHYQGKSKNITTPNVKCPICSEIHYVVACPTYSLKTVQQRLALISKHKLCFNCLGSHRSAECRNVKRCRKCGAKHHTSIHPGKSQDTKTITPALKSKDIDVVKITDFIPSLVVENQGWTHLKGLQLADPNYLSPGPVDILVGADTYGKIIDKGLIKGPSDTPIAQLTKFGWIISGPSQSNLKTVNTRGFHVFIEENLYNLLHRFWEFEEIPSTKVSTLSAEEQACENHFKSTHTRDRDGRYIVRLPFKLSTEKLGDSQTKAVRLIKRLFSQFKTNKDYASAYSEFIAEYERLNHMQLWSTPDSDYLSYYLPHHGVWREQSITTKLRVVFNASSPSSSGYSLNDLLHTGPKLQTDLFDVLIYFRLFRYVFSTDIEKMFRQVKMHPDDWRFQRILWLDHMNELRTYQLTTVTYGLACAPYLALRTLQQLAEDEGSRFPLAITSLTKGRYVDDIFGGADSIEQTKEIVTQLNQLCMAGGFNLQKWSSNQVEVLTEIPEKNRIAHFTVNIKDNVAVKTLGLHWITTTDTFQFTFNLSIPDVITKRVILSNIAKLFDPLGFLAPVIITAKIFIQQLWSNKLGWDDPLPEALALKWTNFVMSLQDTPRLTFPRWIGYMSDLKIELHGFCDASQQAVAAVVYIRTENQNREIKTALLCSKTKVAPLKKLTIPRLELTGAVLLTKLVSHVLKVLNLKNVPLLLWTDSTITYTWLNHHPYRWKDFVHNRVCYVQEVLPQAVWKFVPGVENPADLATRGLTPNQLSQMSSWWTGPHWLTLSPSSWPTVVPSHSFEKGSLEERPTKVTSNTINTVHLWDLINRYSSLMKLLRITAVCKRAISCFKKKPDSSLSNPLSTTDLENARLFWVKLIQQSYFSQQIKLLSRGLSLSASDPLLKLTPFLDSSGLLRVGGRLQYSLLPSSTKHLLILPKESPLSTLIIADAHSRTLHGGTQLTLNYIRNDYWIVGGRVPVRAFIFKCVRCTRYRQKRAQQLMGQLPVERVTPTRPFLHSGVDYAGPFVLKTWKGRNPRTYKAYIALFVCHSTSAVHLELVTDYSAETFIAAFKRFTARRGICSTLSSDCGTTLKGADAELQRLFIKTTQESEKLATLLANDGTQWNFNPPAAPHFGGKWEAGVKSVKYHLHRVIRDTSLTYEELYTLLTQVEATMNSRPLSALSEDPEDLNALTPGHFIMGCAPSLIPEPSLETVKLSHLSRWQLIRQMLDSFWTRWSKECLQRYYARYKWNKVVPSLTVGNLVLVVDERYPPAKWPLGRIIQTHEGKDGLTRVVTVRTQTSILKRPIVKVCPLPIDVPTL
ncbi:uncharacterized protein LOC105198944 [Solenopsis invicta]|uniref:uncharacterized protein LOC105198944 n=1 Tax=Solenopsis invicta TaxID=13686 RepID=UPI00193E6DBF|nr:uncharacterized protein LOC105198944 [Solenopsis invicta]